MSRAFLRTAVLSALLGLSALLSSCEELGEGVVFEVGLLVRQMNATPVDSLETTDPLVRMGIDASGIPTRVEEADLLARRGMEGDPRLIDQAIAIRPADPQYRFLKAARQVALGQSPERSAAEALGLIQYNTPGITQQDLDKAFYEDFLNSLAWAALFSGEEIERDRLRHQYCLTLSSYKTRFPNDTDASSRSPCTPD
jgi:hypothetical protein